MTIREFRVRADAIGQWLSDFAPYISADQKHLDENTPERAYWHHGYRSALLDVIKKLGGDGECGRDGKEG